MHLPELVKGWLGKTLLGALLAIFGWLAVRIAKNTPDPRTENPFELVLTEPQCSVILALVLILLVLFAYIWWLNREISFGLSASTEAIRKKYTLNNVTGWYERDGQRFCPMCLGLDPPKEAALFICQKGDTGDAWQCPESAHLKIYLDEGFDPPQQKMEAKRLSNEAEQVLKFIFDEGKPQSVARIASEFRCWQENVAKHWLDELEAAVFVYYRAGVIADLGHSRPSTYDISPSGREYNWKAGVVEILIIFFASNAGWNFVRYLEAKR